jgi:hypothetical protein
MIDPVVHFRQTADQTFRLVSVLHLRLQLAARATSVLNYAELTGYI